jgi:hypothetical protein
MNTQSFAVNMLSFGWTYLVKKMVDSFLPTSRTPEPLEISQPNLAGLL